MKRYKTIPYSDIDVRRKKVYKSYENYLMAQCRKAYVERENKWNRDYSSIEAYERSIEKNRQHLKEMLGFWEEDREPVKVSKEEKLFEEKNFTVKRIYLNIKEDIWTYCLLLIPHRKSEEGYVPLIVQHGYGGSPEAVCGFIKDAYAPDYSYWALGARAAEKGYFVIAPHHPYGYGNSKESHVTTIPGFEQFPQYGKNRLHRLCVMLGITAFGIDMYGISRAIDYLQQRGDVDTSRIGMYGLSQGGMSALYLPALDTRVKATVCAAYFNDRLKKMICYQKHTLNSYLEAMEEDKFFYGMLKEFGDADIVSLICPRAFCAEIGKKDKAVWWRDAVKEFKQAKAHYEKLGIPERAEYILHEEGHVSKSEEAFQFLDRWLRSKDSIT